MKKSTEEKELRKIAEKHKFENWELASTDKNTTKGIRIKSTMWDNPRPGGLMRFWVQVENHTYGLGAQMNISAFFGAGALYQDAIDGYSNRDKEWPELLSETFTVNAGSITLVKLSHRVSKTRLPGCYMINAILWNLNDYGRAANYHDRRHIRFRIDPIKSKK